jgi:predicted secreted Zn-dependent protease
MERFSLTWRKSRHSGAHSHCVEVAVSPDEALMVRDSKDPDGAVLAFTPSQWEEFTAGIKKGEFGVNP